MKTNLYKKIISTLLAAAMFNAAMPANLIAQEYFNYQLNPSQNLAKPKLDPFRSDPYGEMWKRAEKKVQTKKREEEKLSKDMKSYGYNAYEAAFADYSQTPEAKLSPKQMYALLKTENQKLMDGLLSDPEYQDEKMVEKIGVGAFVCFQVVAILGLSLMFSPAAGAGAEGITASVGGAMMGTYSLSTIATAKAWTFTISAAAIDMGLIMAAMGPVNDLYFRLTARIEKYQKMQDTDFIVNKKEDTSDAYKKANETCMDFTPDQKLITADRWNDTEIQRGAIVTLYGLRYINNYLKNSKDPIKYDLALVEYIQLVTVIDYKTQKNVSVESNFGALMDNQLREKWSMHLRTLRAQEMAERKKMSDGLQEAVRKGMPSQDVRERYGVYF
ncbi:putative membrane protein [Elusimicrobium posterum]|uniref:hypothetical protein n=1 Tax=Elusimicrobium posterum TaxID=3116653 RepID=UPI003C7455BC